MKRGTGRLVLRSVGGGKRKKTMIRLPRFDPFEVAIALFGAAFFVGLSIVF
jgi:hypothetical protein